MSTAPARSSCALARRVQVLARVHQCPRRGVAQHAQAFEVAAQDRVFHPQQREAGVPDGVQFDQCFLRPPGLIRVDHQDRVWTNRLVQQLQPRKVAIEVGVAYLDLERLEPLCVGALEECLEVGVAEVVVETGGVGPDTAASAAEEAMQRQAGLLRGKIPERHLDRLVERKAEGALIAAARSIDPMDKRCGRLADKGRPRFFLEDPNDLVVVGQRVEQRLDEAEAALSVVGDQLKRCGVQFLDLNLAVPDDPVPGVLEAGDAKLGQAHGRPLIYQLLC